MSTQNPSLAGNFESTAQRMLEVLDKAAAELSRNVSDSVEQLSVYNFGLQKSLTDQLQQVSEKLQSFTETRTDDLENCKGELVRQIDEFAQSEIETVAATGQAVRQSLSSYTQQALEKITQEVEQQLQELRSLLDEPEQDINNRAGDAIATLKDVSESGLETIETTAADAEDSLSKRVQEFEQQLAEIVSDWKDNIQDKVESSQNGFAMSASKIIDELNNILDTSVSELDAQAKHGAEVVRDCIAAGQERASSTFTEWKKQVDEISAEFGKSVESGKEKVIEGESHEIEQKLTHAKDEITNVASDAREKIRNSHKLFQQSLRKLEQDYERRLQLLISTFETTVSETLRRSTTAAAMEQRSSSDLMETLTSQLNARGDDMLRGIRRMTEQLEIEYSKSWQGMESRIEQIKDTTLESFTKQVQSMKSESEAYRSALLSLGGE
jgi:DNA anti-recombination protein RmuC